MTLKKIAQYRDREKERLREGETERQGVWGEREKEKARHTERQTDRHMDWQDTDTEPAV